MHTVRRAFPTFSGGAIAVQANDWRGAISAAGWMTDELTPEMDEDELRVAALGYPIF